MRRPHGLVRAAAIVAIAAVAMGSAGVPAPAGARGVDVPTGKDGGPSAAPRRKAIADRYVVTVAEGFTVGEVLASHRRGVRPGRRFGAALSGLVVQADAAAVARLRADHRIVAVEQDELFELATTQHPVTWGLDRLDQVRRPLDKTYTYGRAGKGVTVYVLDTGVFAAHREFGGRVAAGFDATGGGTTKDCEGHGTHVAGTIAGRTYGVAKAARIVPVRLTRCNGNIRKSHLLAALDFVARHHRTGRPAVANLSLGGPASATVDRAVKRVIRDGVTVVVAAGNWGVDSCRLSPARVAEAITVGATNARDEAPYWSNYGPCLDVFAPGVRIVSASLASRTAARAHDGTSMAAPHVAGAAARFLSARRGASPADVAHHLKSTALAGTVRQPGPDTTDRLLHVRGKVPTRLSASTPSSQVVRGGLVTVRGVLRNKLSGAAIAGQTVVLQRRRIGSSTWRTVNRSSSAADGRVAVGHDHNFGAYYRLVHRGSSGSRRAVSGSVKVVIDPRGTAVSMTSAPASIVAGATVTLTGKLSRTHNGAAVTGAPVDLYAMRAHATAWTFIGRKATDGIGRVTFVQKPTANITYELRHPGTATTLASKSSRGVAVAFHVDAALSQPSAPTGEHVTLSGTITPAPPDATVQLWIDTGGGWGLSHEIQAPSGAVTHDLYVNPGTRRYQLRVPATVHNAAGKGPILELTGT